MTPADASIDAILPPVAGRAFFVDAGPCVSCAGTGEILGWRPCPDCAATGRHTDQRPRPGSAEDARAFVRLGDRLARVEADARVLARRLSVWHREPRDTFTCCWSRAPDRDPDVHLFSAFAHALTALRGARQLALGLSPEPWPAVASYRMRLSKVVPQLVADHADWKAAAKDGLVPWARDGYNIPTGTFADLGDPFGPLFAILDAGVVVDDLMGDLICLYAPAVEAERAD